MTTARPMQHQMSANQPIYQQPQLAPQPTGQERQNQLIEQLQLVQANNQVDWAAKIAEVMQDQFGLKPKQQTTCTGLHIQLHMICFHFLIGIRCPTSLIFRDRMKLPPLSILIAS
jgi:hypothetical protein